MRITRFIRLRYEATVEPYETLHHAAARMRSTGLSALPVMRRDVVIGLITEKDLVKAIAIGGHPCEARVADYMTTGAIAAAPYDEASVALLKMLAIGCLHLPVVSEHQFVGMVSARELLATQTVVQGVAV
jgi:signal-transduction protein with cAMP-binding, CBS, and nucleotidyltransferase domain